MRLLARLRRILRDRQRRRDREQRRREIVEFGRRCGLKITVKGNF